MKRPSLPLVIEILRSMREYNRKTNERIGNPSEYERGRDHGYCYALSLLDPNGDEKREIDARRDPTIADELLGDATKALREYSGDAPVSHLQRTFRIGYIRAINLYGAVTGKEADQPGTLPSFRTQHNPRTGGAA